MRNDSDEISLRFMARLGLFLARFCTSAWIGAASLFVIVGITEVTRTGFDSATKDVLVAVRFPAYYVCGVTLVSLGWSGLWMAGDSFLLPRPCRLCSLLLLSLVLIVMAVDYVWIYQPLVEMVNPPGQIKPATFIGYHQASKWINLVGLTLCLMATILVNWPVKIADHSSPTPKR